MILASVGSFDVAGNRRVLHRLQAGTNRVEAPDMGADHSPKLFLTDFRGTSHWSWSDSPWAWDAIVLSILCPVTAALAPCAFLAAPSATRATIWTTRGL